LAELYSKNVLRFAPKVARPKDLSYSTAFGQCPLFIQDGSRFGLLSPVNGHPGQVRLVATYFTIPAIKV